MKNWKSIIAATAALLPLAASAGSGWVVPPTPINAPTDFNTLVMGVTNWILGFTGLAAVLVIIWGGVQYLTSTGDQDRVRSAKDTVKYGVMGLAIAGIAYAVVNVIIGTILRA